MERIMADERIKAALAGIAERATDNLFTNGSGDKARRLVLELENGKDGGGWCRSSARDRIAAELDALVPVLELAQMIAVLHVDGEEFGRLCPEFKDEQDNQRIRWALEDRLRESLAELLRGKP